MFGRFKLERLLKKHSDAILQMDVDKLSAVKYSGGTLYDFVVQSKVDEFMSELTLDNLLGLDYALIDKYQKGRQFTRESSSYPLSENQFVIINDVLYESRFREVYEATCYTSFLSLNSDVQDELMLELNSFVLTSDNKEFRIKSVNNGLLLVQYELEVDKKVTKIGTSKTNKFIHSAPEHSFMRYRR